jgi:hypothetical protein
MWTFRHLSRLKEMGEVRTSVKLTNAVDDALARRQQSGPTGGCYRLVPRYFTRALW